VTDNAPDYSIILAAGSGKRMRSPNLHKVCFPIAGVPAIRRAIETYSESGIHRHVVVVGDKAEQVMAEASRDRDDVIFVYQHELTGTADAARIGLAPIAESGGIGDLAAGGEDLVILIVAGDKVVRPGILKELYSEFFDNSCDLAFVTGNPDHGTGLGRIVLDDTGRVIGNEEETDIVQRRVLADLRLRADRGEPMTAGQVRQTLEQSLGSKAPVAFRCVWDLVEAGASIDPEQIRERVPDSLTRFRFFGHAGVIERRADEIDGSPRNQSIYAVKASVLRYALAHLPTDNAQNERYLSDIITVLVQTRRSDGSPYTVRAVHTDDRRAVMAFNNPEELLEIEQWLRGTTPDQGTDGAEKPAVPNSVDSWLRRLLTGGSYETGHPLRAALARAAEELGPDAPVFLVRSPGRVNLLGRHVDHQGGHCNLMTIGYETIAVVHASSDDTIRLFNVDSEQFPDHAFSIGEIVAKLPWDDWLDVVDSDAVLDMARQARGQWHQYVVAAAVRLQKKFRNRKLRGADLVVAGNIPQAAGLSSSSALVVAVAEALIKVNALEIAPNQLVDLAGEGEWFVGTRGGSADHAAIKLGQKGKVVKVSFFPFVVEGIYAFPTDHVLAVCNSGIKAQKTSGARDQFNHRVACYRIGFELIRDLFPQYRSVLHHLRDVNSRTLHAPAASIYGILMRLPESASRNELRKLCSSDIERFFESHAEPEDQAYPIRGVVLYGLAEFERSRTYADALSARDFESVGRLMRVSHDGDRVARLVGGEMVPWRSPTSDEYLRRLVDDLESGDPERVVSAQLDRQPGSYRCSLPEIDRMVDIANGVNGVVGSQLAGAGLGGCMMVLVSREAAPDLRIALTREYYEPEGREADVLLCEPVEGSGLVEIG